MIKLRSSHHGIAGTLVGVTTTCCLLVLFSCGVVDARLGTAASPASPTSPTTTRTFGDQRILEAVVQPLLNAYEEKLAKFQARIQALEMEHQQQKVGT